jgi:hypothetical protein
MTERDYLRRIENADDRIKKAKRFLSAMITAIMATIGLLLFFGGVDLPGAMNAVGLWIFFPILVAEIVVGVIAIVLENEANDRLTPWEEKRRVVRNYHDWLEERADGTTSE